MTADSAPSLLITGGSGFIGCRLAQLARQQGFRVTVTSAINTDSERHRVEALAAAGIATRLVRLEDRAGLAAALPGHEAVIHLAAAQHESGVPESYFRAVNVEGTHNLLEAAAASGVRRFVHGSTIGVYGAAAHGVLDESSPLAPDNPYGRTKAAAEALVRGFADRLQVCIARISETYGPGDMRLLKLFRALARGRFVTLGDGRNEHQLIYVDDLVQGLLRAAVAERAAGKTFVLAGAERLTTDAMVGAIGAVVGHEAAPRHLPLWPFDLTALACERTLAPLGVKPPLHRRRLDFFRKSYRFSTLRAEQLLGFRAETPFAEGVRRTAEWYYANGYLSRSAKQASPRSLRSSY